MKHALCDVDVLEGFDFSRGLERLQGNRELYFQILRNFSERYRSCSTRVEAALALRDRENAHQLVHNLKGLAGNLSATALYEAARSLDEALKEPIPDWPEVEKRFPDFEGALEQAVRSADRLIEEYGTTPHEPVNPESIPAALARNVARKIRETVALGDIMAVVELASDASLGSELQNRINRLLDDLDFAGLSALADELEEKPPRKSNTG